MVGPCVRLSHDSYHVSRHQHRSGGRERNRHQEFIHDVWGDTVNLASRMESHGIKGEIRVTDAVHERMRENCVFKSVAELRSRAAVNKKRTYSRPARRSWEAPNLYPDKRLNPHLQPGRGGGSRPIFHSFASGMDGIQRSHSGRGALFSTNLCHRFAGGPMP
jgi:hypothetical protein